jgi:hypothetical protein
MSLTTLDDARRTAVGFPRLDAAFRAVEAAILRLGITQPHALKSPQPVEEALGESIALQGSLLILDPSELRAAEFDVEETVADERGGGTVFVNLPNPRELAARRVRYRDLASAAAGFAFVDDPAEALGFGRFHAVVRPQGLSRYRIVLADTPGFRVVVASRSLRSGGFVGIWSGNADLVDEISDRLRTLARDAGQDVPDAAAPVPVLEGIAAEKDVWKQAAELRALREVRENELREIARAAALRGVALRRERAAAQARAGAA